jgi:NADPH-dependent ferric siderophore reductase
MTSPKSVTNSFSLEREWLDLQFRAARLTSRTFLCESYLRIRVEGDSLAGFGSASGVDDHVRIFLPGYDAADAPVTDLPSGEELREFPSREFTPLEWGTTDDGVPYLDLEFALHGDLESPELPESGDGVASRWAVHAPIGSPIGIGGPRGTTRIVGSPDGWLLAGDETAIAQIRRYAATIPEDVPALILIEVRNGAHQVDIETTAPVAYVHRGSDGIPGAALAAALLALDDDDKPGEDPFVFIAAEQAIVKPARDLAARWGIDIERTEPHGEGPGSDGSGPLPVRLQRGERDPRTPRVVTTGWRTPSRTAPKAA